MTDPSDPTSRPPRRKDDSRKPPTIDLKAKVVGAGTPEKPAAAAQDAASRPASELPAEPTTDESNPVAATPHEVTPDAPVSDADMTSAADPLADSSETVTDGPPATPIAEAGSESDAPPTAVPGPAVRQGPGYGGLAGAGLLGGLVGAGLVWALQAWSPQSSQDGARLAQIEQRLGSLPQTDAMPRIESRIGAVEGQQGQIAQRLQAAQALAERAAARAEEAANRPAPAAPQNNQALADLGNRLGALETQIRERTQAAAAAAQTSTTAIQDLGNRLGALEAQGRERTQAATEAAQSSATALQGLERRLAEQEQRLSDLSRQVAEGGSDATRAGTRVVLADRLNNALRDGAPYAEVLAALGQFDVDPARIQPLQPFAERGAPTASALAQAFEPIAERILRETRSGTETWTDRVARMAEKVVTIRSPNQSDAPGVPGLVDRVESALGRDAFADAVSAWDALPEPARRQSEEFGTRLKQRAAAEAASRAIAADAVAALNPTTR